MEVQAQEKPRMKYADWAAQQLQQHRKGTLSWLIERFITELDQPGLGKKPTGISQRYTLRQVGRSWFGQKLAAEIDNQDVIAYCKEQRERIQPATIEKHISYVSGVLKYASCWRDCKGISAKAIEDANAYLRKNHLIAKSTPRKVRPTPEQLQALIEHYQISPRRKIPMHIVELWQNYSSRRISETCRLLWADWNREDQTILVRGMKDPRKRNKDKVVALTPQAQAMLVALEPLQTTERIFPYNHKSCGAAHRDACKALGIKDLWLHDNRRDRATRLVEDDGYSCEEAILFTGHDSTQVYQRNYLAMKPELMKLGPRSKREQSAA